MTSIQQHRIRRVWAIIYLYIFSVTHRNCLIRIVYFFTLTSFLVLWLIDRFTCQWPGNSTLINCHFRFSRFGGFALVSNPVWDCWISYRVHPMPSIVTIDGIGSTLADWGFWIRLEYVRITSHSPRVTKFHICYPSHLKLLQTFLYQHVGQLGMF